MRESDKLDEKNLQILAQIRHNARMTYEEIGQRVGLSRVAVKNRIKDMEAAGIILEYETKLKRINAGNAQSFVIEVETNPGDFESVMDLLGQNPYIQQLFVMTGNNHIHAFGSVPNMDTLKVYVNRLNKELSNVKRFSFHAVLAVRKDVDGGIEYHEDANG